MKDIFKNWSTISKKIQKYKHLLLLSDFDGTLCEIAKKPEQVRLSKKVKFSLKNLKELSDVTLGIISGRPLKDIKKIIGIKKIFYVGNHGLELECVNKRGRRKNFTLSGIKKTLPTLKKIKDELKKELDSIEGVIVEDKLYTLSVHYRMVKKKDIRRVKRIFQKVMRNHKISGKVKVTSGKKVFEVRPPVDWHKGKAVIKIKRILNKRNLMTIYLGDDVTDEDAFRALNRNDISVFVGAKKKSNAKYKIKNTDGVKDLLDILYKLRSNHEED